MLKRIGLLSLLFFTFIGTPLKAQNTSVLSKKINFHYTHTTLNKSGEKLLDEVANHLIKYPSLKVKLKGHSCNTPSKEDALTIGKQRAEIVKEYLIGKGVDENQLLSQSFGLQNPILPNDSEYGRIKNRRVEFEIIKN